MLDTVLRRRLDGPLAPIAAWLAAHKVRSLALTLSAFLCAAVAMLDIGHRAYLLALGLLAVAGIFDALDGAVARREGATVFGAYLESVLSLIATAGIAFAFALAQPDRALAAMFLMLGLVARAGARTTAASTGSVPAIDLVDKSVLFLAFALACLFPDWFSIIAYLLGVAGFVAAGSRVAAAAMQRL